MSARAGALRPFQPRRFGRFTLLAPLAAGGMGQIYLARARFAGGLEKLCVIKKILPQLARDPDFAQRFREEAQTLVRLQHGSIAQVYDSGEEGGEWWIALEFVDGKDLRRLLQRLRGRGERMPLPLALFVATKVLEALGYAHRKKDDEGNELGLVHRDVSPQNVLISYEGEVKVIDFGLARSTISAPEADPSVVMGKFHYMAPEQAQNLEVDRRADLYAVGVILYEAITGWNPFEDAPPGEVLEWAATPRIPPIQRLAPHASDMLAEAVHTALAPDPARRFASAEEMRGRLAACLSELAPGTGPEQLGDLLQSEFAEEFARERAWIASFGQSGRDASPAAEEVTRVAPAARAVSGRQRLAAGTLRYESASPRPILLRERAAADRLAAQTTEPGPHATTRPVEPLLPWDRDRSGGAAALRSAAAAATSAPRAVPWYDRASGAGGFVPPPEPTPVPPPAVEPPSVEIELPLADGAGAAPEADALQVPPEAIEAPDAGPQEVRAEAIAPAPSPADGVPQAWIPPASVDRRSAQRWFWPAAAALAIALPSAWLLLLRTPPPPPVVRGPEPAVAAPARAKLVVLPGPAPAEAPPPAAVEPTPEPLPRAAPVARVAVGEPAPAPTRAREPLPAPRPAPGPVVEAPTIGRAPPDRRAGLVAQHRRVMRKYEEMVATHGADQVGGIVAGLVRATDSQFKRLIDQPRHHDDLQRQLDDLDRLLEERRRAFER